MTFRLQDDPTKINQDNLIIVFDEVCVLCSWLVKWIAKKDKKYRFMFTSQETALRLGWISEAVNTVLVLESEQQYERGTAVIKILNTLGGFWSFVGVLLSWMPIRMLNFFYNLVAKSRYFIFGKHQACTLMDSTLIDKIIV